MPATLDDIPDRGYTVAAIRDRFNALLPLARAGRNIITYNDVATMLADTSPGLAAGTRLLTAQGHAYRVLPANAPAGDVHLTTAGGVKLVVLPGAQGLDLAAFAPQGNGADDTAVLQRWLNAVGTTNYGSSGFFTTASPAVGNALFAPAGRYRFTSTLTVPNNVVIAGAGLGTKFEFDPTAPNSDAFRLKAYSGQAMNGVSVRFRDFMLYPAPTGATAVGRNGGDLPLVNSNARHGINASDSTAFTCERVGFYNWHFGRGVHMELVNPTFAFYNKLDNCIFYDCFEAFRLSSSSYATDCTILHTDRYPAQSRMAEHQYVIDMTGSRGCVVTASVEGYASVALVRDNGAGHRITLNYAEAKSGTPAIGDLRTMPETAGSSFWAGGSYGFTSNFVHPEKITRATTFGTNLGVTYSFGDCSEIELMQATTFESPSFRHGLSGRGHFPAGGTLDIATDSFIDPTCLVLSRAAGTASTANAMTYNFKARNSAAVNASVFVTVLLKFEGGETAADCSLRLLVPGNQFLSKLMTYANGWELWGTYFTPTTGDWLTTLSITQNAGFTDTARKVRVTALRAYLNGFLPLPTTYNFREYRQTVPTGGHWRRGDVVLKANAAVGQPSGWQCVDAAVPTFGALPNLV